MMMKVLKKPKQNPILMMGFKEFEEIYQSCETDEELAKHYHDMLHAADYLERIGNKLHHNLRNWTYAMMAFSIERPINLPALI